METASDFIFLGSKITADGDCSHEIKRHLLLRRKVMTNINSIFKSTPMVDSCQCMTKPIQYCKVKYSKNKNLKKKKEKKIGAAKGIFHAKMGIIKHKTART